MSLTPVYHASRVPRKPISGSNTERIRTLAALGLSQGAILVKLILLEKGGFVPKEQLAQILHCSVRQVLRYLGEIKRAQAVSPTPDTAAAEVAAAGLNETAVSYRQTDNPFPVPSSPVRPSRKEPGGDNNGQTVRSSPPLDPHLHQEIHEIARQWRIPNLERILPSRLQIAIQQAGGYIAGTLTAAWEVAHQAWLHQHCYNRVGYLIGVFRQMLPEVFAWMEELQDRLALVRIAGRSGELNVPVEIQKQLEYWEEIGGAPGVAAAALRLAFGA